MVGKDADINVRLSWFDEIREDLCRMREQGLFFRAVSSNCDKAQLQACVGEIGDVITDIQLDLLVTSRVRMKGIRDDLKVCTHCQSFL